MLSGQGALGLVLPEILIVESTFWQLRKRGQSGKMYSNLKKSPHIHCETWNETGSWASVRKTIGLCLSSLSGTPVPGDWVCWPLLCLYLLPTPEFSRHFLCCGLSWWKDTKTTCSWHLYTSNDNRSFSLLSIMWPHVLWAPWGSSFRISKDQLILIKKKKKEAVTDKLRQEFVFIW